MNRILSITKRNVKEILREPTSLIFLIGMPVVMQILFYLIFHSLTEQFEMKHLAPSMVGFANTFLMLFLAMLVSTDRDSAFITRIYTTPVSPFEFILGYLLAVLPLGLVQTAVILLVGGVVDVSMLSPKLLLVIPASLPSVLLFSSLGLLLGSLFNPRAVGGVSSILISAHSVLSGMWFPLEGMSEGFITFMNVLPFRHISTLLKSVSLGVEATDAFSCVWMPVIVVSAYAAVCAAGACAMFVRNSRQK